jgi:hypothetical protein
MCGYVDLVCGGREVLQNRLINISDEHQREKILQDIGR